MVSTPFAFDVVENSMRVVVDGDDIRVAFSNKDLQREPLRACLWSGCSPVVTLVL